VFWSPSSLLFSGTWVSLRGGKSGIILTLSFFFAEIKIGGAIYPMPQTSSWHGAYLIKHMGNFTLVPSGCITRENQ
jgi:hypothetical protein